MNKETLYKRSAKNEILRWQINELVDGTISIAHGVYGHKPITEFIKPTLIKVNEVKSRINAKRKEGYKSLEELWDNAPTEEQLARKGYGSDYDIDKENIYNYLQTYLPKYNTTSDGFVLPMLAKTLEDNKPFEKYHTMLGQWKINGLRCIIGAEKTKGDLFRTHHYTYTSREGTKWDLSWMDELLDKKLNNYLIELMVENGVCLDGELYLPGYKVNEIDSFVKNKDVPKHKLLQYWCYDLAYDGITANGRHEILRNNEFPFIANFNSIEEHLNNKKQFIVLPTVEVSDITEAKQFRDYFIVKGFEGLILRNPNAEYAFGKRNSSMFKYKKKQDGLFVIVDIKEDKRGLPIYTLKNDINDELFDCTINIPQDKQREQLKIKDMLIGKTGMVEYRERSGVKQVPFHAKLIKIYV